MKKTALYLLGFSLFILFFGNGLSVNAEENEQYIYIIEGVEYTSIVPLSTSLQEELRIMVNETSPDTLSEGVIKPFVDLPHDGGAPIINGPVYTTHSNMAGRYFVSAVVAAVATRIPYSKPAYESMGAVLGFNLGFAGSEIITPTYVGAWQFKTWENGRYRIYNTLVHYKYGSYTTPINVQTYPVGWE